MKESDVRGFLESFFIEMAKWEEFCGSELDRVKDGEVSYHSYKSGCADLYEGIATRFCDMDRCLTASDSFSSVPRYDAQKIVDIKTFGDVVVAETRCDLPGGSVVQFKYEVELCGDRLAIVGRWFLFSDPKSETSEWVAKFI